MNETADKPHGEHAGQPARPTLKSIAYMTGLGVTTVSKALKDAPDISAKTKERVRLVANQIGYRPNRAGVRLRTGKTHVISLVLAAETGGLGLSSHLIYGISDYLAATPYHLIVTPYDQEGDPMAPVRYIVETGAADGVIISRIEPKDQRIVYLQEHGIAVAAHGRSDMDVVHPFVDYDNAAFARLAVEALAGRGRRRLALLAPPAHLSFARHLGDGVRAGIAAAGVSEIPITKVTTDSPEADIAAEIQRLMSSKDRPDGMICGSASAAITTIAAAERAGLKIGADFDLAVKESHNIMKTVRPDIIVFHEDFRDAGRRLAEAIVARLAGADPARLQTLVEPVRV